MFIKNSENDKKLSLLQNYASLNDEDPYIQSDPVQIEILLKTRDHVGKLIVNLWKKNGPNEFTLYSRILKNMIQVKNDMSNI